MDPRRMLPVLALLAAATLALTAGTAVVRHHEPAGGPGPAAGGGPDGGVGSTVGSTAAPPDRSTAGSTAGDGSTAEGGGPAARDRRGAAAVLARWDRRRAAAWAAGSPSRLAALYTPGSRAGVLDVARLRSWATRGLRVVGMQTQVLSLMVVERVPGRRLVVVVTDRVVGAVARGAGPSRLPLPADRPTRRVVRLVRNGGRWRVAEVRDHDSAAASTSRTSSSSKS